MTQGGLPGTHSWSFQFSEGDNENKYMSAAAEQQSKVWGTLF
jgi:hypothetical protein